MADLVPVEPKPFYQSKTFWLQVVGIVAVIWPTSSAFIQEHFAATGVAWGLINMILRAVTKGRIEIL